jgi:hypothetical protein
LRKVFLREYTQDGVKDGFVSAENINNIFIETSSIGSGEYIWYIVGQGNEGYTYRLSEWFHDYNKCDKFLESIVKKIHEFK